ncbi:MAG TPA: FAD-dependent oxidoreductase [Phycicoccus elongatus]|nr:FAD-dependent oxidoreductase [Phycicoccus elongatus]
MSHTTTPPQRIAVIGAGMVGLSTAWYLQEQGAEVSVIESTSVAAGSSWGNAGWLTPGITTPLPEPAVLRTGIRAVLSPSSPVYVPPKADANLARFVAGFTRNSTAARWRRNMAALVPVNRMALDAFDDLSAGGVQEPTRQASSFIAAYQRVEQRRTLLEEIEHIGHAGQEMSFEALTGDEARAIEPVLSDEIRAAILLKDQRFIDPGAYVAALAAAVEARGGQILTGLEVMGVEDRGSSVVLRGTRGWSSSFDSVVLATGAWLGEHARQFGVRQVVQAGRGYSFSVKVDDLPAGPVYLPAARVACTPIGDRLRVAGMMEFRRPEEALDQRRIQAIVEAARPLLRGVDLDDRTDEWVGSRPCTVDGLPLIGATRSPRVHVAGGHSMWGITLGPVTGKLLAEQIMTGTTPAELAPFDPLR